MPKVKITDGLGQQMDNLFLIWRQQAPIWKTGNTDKVQQTKLFAVIIGW
jgi:hypothetical protein